MNAQIDLLLRSYDEAFDRKSWHGTNLNGSIRGVDLETASYRPQPNRHSIREIVVHCAYWKYAVHRRLVGGKRGSFPYEGSDWFARPYTPSDDPTTWNEDKRLLTRTHKSLREAIASLNPDNLNTPAEGGTTTVLSLVTGIVAHDLYHAGQIQLIKRMHSEQS